MSVFDNWITDAMITPLTADNRLLTVPLLRSICFATHDAANSRKQKAEMAKYYWSGHSGGGNGGRGRGLVDGRVRGQ